MSHRKCTALTGHIIDDVRVRSAYWVNIANVANLEVCVVNGHRPPYLDIEVVLPANWSGRYLQQGGSGLDGQIPSAIFRDDKEEIIGAHDGIETHGAVYASSNGGNRLDQPGQGAPEVWLDGSADAKASLLDFSYLALEKTLGFAHGLMQQVYGHLPEFSYFNGSSNGGRHAYIVAQRWPQHFDGIVAGKETMNIEGVAIAWLKMSQIAATPAALSAAQYRYAYQAALKHCDGIDGTRDGLLMNAYACDFEVNTLSCDSTPAELCLSNSQVATLELLLSDNKDRNDKVISSAFPWTDFSEFSPFFSAYAGVSGLMATGDPSWMTTEKLAQFDVDRDQHMIISGMRHSGAAHDVIGVAQYVAAGKKLISWHGGSDNLHPAKDHARMFQTMMGIAAHLAEGSTIDPGQSAEFFIVPGAMHGEGAFPEVNWLAAIIDWVEKAKRPTGLIFERDGSSLPVCEFEPYPDFSKPWPECRADSGNKKQK
ncbi:MAG: tannase/feruloyl esterase family alpha/beta hydrolase [Pseudomonadales bacterium]